MMNIKSLLVGICLIISFPILAKEVVVEIYKKEFIPALVTVNVGDTVIWKNIEKRQYHNVWFKHLTTEEPDYIFPGESFKVTFDEAGVYKYLCGPHPQMTGEVQVIMP